MSTRQIGRFPSPLRYPGGKGKIANFLKLLIAQNDLVGVEYVEPYAGGASVALSLLFEEYCDYIHINDLNPGVHAFWKAVLEEVGELCARIEHTPVTVDEWLRQRDVQRQPAADTMDLAFSTFFLNRTNRSGIISGGVIGGLDQTGPFKMDARYNLADLIRRIRKVNRFRSRISLTNLDAAVLLPRWASGDEPQALLYLDPPYYVKGEGLYDNFYTHQDHQRIAELVTTLAHPWVVSYDAAPEIGAMYRQHRRLRYGLSYSAATQVAQGRELMFFSDGLQVPDRLPANITARMVRTAVTAMA